MRKGFWIVTLVLVIISAFFMGETAISQSKSKLKAGSSAYHEMEKEYLKSTRKLLREKGYENSGVNLTKTIDEEGNRTYTVKIHNSKINALEKEEKEALLEALEEVPFADEACGFSHEFLVDSSAISRMTGEACLHE